jgi:hypothetical protein
VSQLGGIRLIKETAAAPKFFDYSRYGLKFTRMVSSFVLDLIRSLIATPSEQAYPELFQSSPAARPCDFQWSISSTFSPQLKKKRT